MAFNYVQPVTGLANTDYYSLPYKPTGKNLKGQRVNDPIKHRKLSYVRFQRLLADVTLRQTVKTQLALGKRAKCEKQEKGKKHVS